MGIEKTAYLSQRAASLVLYELIIMMAQILEPKTQFLDPWELPSATPPALTERSEHFCHTLALFNPLTIDEQILSIYTRTPFYSDVHHELAHQMAVQGLIGYKVRAILSSPCGF